MRKRVLVLMGGLSTEHEVSLASGTEIVRALDPKKYNIHPVFVSRENEWLWSSREIGPYKQTNFNAANYFADWQGASCQKEKSPALSQLPDADIAFLAFHGRFGEDGRIQSLLEFYQIPYTGSGVLGSALAMDKIQSKWIYVANGIPTAPFEVLNRSDFNGESLSKIAEKLHFPLVIKDPCGGSSLDMGIASDMEQALALCEQLFPKNQRLLFEQYIAGEEASCGYIEDFKPLPATEIRMTSQDFFDFKAKYQGASQEVTPAEFSSERMTRIQSLVRQAHEALGCHVYSRTDVRVDAQGEIYVIETNTLPGFTSQSLLPQQAACLGINYSQLLDLIIDKSLQVKRGF